MPNKDFLPAPIFLPCFCKMVVFGEDKSSDKNSYSTLMGLFPNEGKARMVKSSSQNRGKYKKLDFYKLGVTLKDLRDMKLMRLWRQSREVGWILDLVEEMG